MNYNLELKRVVSNIKDCKKVLIQLPDGLKPKAKEIKEYIESNTSAKVFIWMGSCFGSCDVPNVSGFDMLIQWGHSTWM